MNSPAGGAVSALTKPVSTVPEEDSLRDEYRQRLEKNLISRIQRQTGCKIKQLSVEVHPGLIRIGGSCWTFYTKQLAQHAVMALSEGEEIANEIEVNAP